MAKAQHRFGSSDALLGILPQNWTLAFWLSTIFCAHNDMLPT